MNSVSNSYNFIIKEAHEIIATESYRNTWINQAMTLSQLGYSDEKKRRVVFISSIKDE